MYHHNVFFYIEELTLSASGVGGRGARLAVDGGGGGASVTGGPERLGKRRTPVWDGGPKVHGVIGTKRVGHNSSEAMVCDLT